MLRGLVVCLLLVVSQQDVITPPGFSWKDIELSTTNHNFPLTYPDKDYVFGQIRPFLEAKGFLDSESSVGCAALNLESWYSTLNTSEPKEALCPALKPVLVYSEVTFGMDYLSTILNRSPSIVFTNDFFSGNSCGNRSLAISLYNQLLCSMQVPSVDVNVTMIGLDRSEYWGVSGIEAIDYPAQNNISVLMFVRQNSLSRSLADAEVASKNITKNRLSKHVKHAVKTRTLYTHYYCSLKSKGVDVMILSYEDLLFDFNRTMRKLMEFLGAGKAPWWRRMEFETPLLLKDKIVNVQQVRGYLEAMGPEYVCLLDENCRFPPFVCPVEEA